MNLHEKQILKKLHNGNETAFRELFDLYYKPLCVFALKYVDSIVQAEDLVQDTFIRFLDNKSFKNINSGLKSYLFQAVKNNCLNFIRKNSRFRFEEIEARVLEMVDDEIDNEYIEILKAKLKKEIEALPQKGKDIFTAIVFNGMKYKEVAELYGISINTVKTHYSRSLSKLRNSLDLVVMVMMH